MDVLFSSFAFRSYCNCLIEDSNSPGPGFNKHTFMHPAQTCVHLIWSYFYDLLFIHYGYQNGSRISFCIPHDPQTHLMENAIPLQKNPMTLFIFQQFSLLRVPNGEKRIAIGMAYSIFICARLKDDSLLFAAEVQRWITILYESNVSNVSLNCYSIFPVSVFDGKT